MKSVTIFKQMFIAMAAITMVGCLSSCKDQDFDWDNAHANTPQAKFTDAFVKAYGKPADDHQWGFDMSWANQEGTRSVSTTADGDNQLIVVKPDAGEIEHAYVAMYGGVPDINKREHQEVYDWFCNHKVTWKNTTKKIGVYYYYEGDAPAGLSKVKVYDKDGEEVKISDDLKTGVGPIPNCTIKDGDGNIIEKIEQGDIMIYGADNGCLIVKAVYFDGKNLTRDENLTAVSTGELMAKNSIKNMPSNYWQHPGGSVEVGTRMKATNIWIQHVASENKSDSNADVYSKYFNEGVDEYAFDGTSAVAAGHMDYLEIFGINGIREHENDYNGGNGYGWGLVKDVTPNNAFPGLQIRRNGELILGIDMNNLSIHNSVDNKLHDKWILVHLTGGYEKDYDYLDKDGNPTDTRYEGYYLGFDFEGGQNGLGLDKHFTANGYCNDWIFKVSSLSDKTIPFRIMCEDLGGIGNAVNVSESRIMISDIDYNDIVLDIDKEGVNVTLTLQAAGGTLPLTVWYGETILFETHELFEAGKLYPEGYTADFSKMYRTGNGTIETGAKSVKMIFNGSNVWDSSVAFDTTNRQFTSNGKFDWNKLAIKVYRFDKDDYRGASKDFAQSVDIAAWINLTNMRGEAPLKLCVPKDVKWLKERVAIHEGYPYFEDWVIDQGDYFWKDKRVVSSNLYGGN